MPYGNPWDDDGDDPFRPVSFRDYARSQPAPALLPIGAGPVRRTDSMEWGKGVMDTLRQFVFRVPERVVANVGNAADLFEQVGRAAVQSGSLNPAVVAPQAAINSVSPAVGGEGLVERFITNPVQEGLDKLAGGDPENAREAVAAMGGSVVGEGLSMLGGGRALTSLAGKSGAEAMAKLPGTVRKVLPGRAGRVATSPIVGRTARDVGLATPYNVANAMDEKDSMAAVLETLGDVEGEGRTADVVRTLSGLGERSNQSPAGRLGLEFGTDIALSGIINSIGPIARGVARTAKPATDAIDEAVFGGASAPARARADEAREAASAAPEMMTLRHYGPGASQPSLDPSMHGRGIRGAESKRKAAYPDDWQDRTYFYTEARADRPEPGLRRNEFVDVEVDRSTILPEERFPEFWEAAREELGDVDPAAIATRAERLIREAGFEGYERQGAVAKFTPTGTGRFGEFAGRVARMTRENDGATVDPVTGADRGGTAAYAVAAHPDLERIVPDDENLEAAIEGYLRDNWDLLKQEGNELGAWRNGDQVHLDVSRVHLDRDEAMAAMRANNERAAFDLENFEDILNPDFDAAARSGSVDAAGKELGNFSSQMEREAAIREAMTQLGIATAGGGAIAYDATQEDGGLIAGLGAVGLAMAAPTMVGKQMTRAAAARAANAVVTQPDIFGAALLYRGVKGAEWQAAMAKRFGEEAGPELLEKSTKVLDGAISRVIDMPHTAGDVFREGDSPRMLSFDELVDLAKRGDTEGAGEWYEGVYPTLQKYMSPEDAEMFVRFLAATSAGSAATSSNITFAKKAFVQWKLGEPFLASGRFPSPWQGSTGQMLNDALLGTDFGGPKIRNYYLALMGDENAVVIDDWMSRAFGWGTTTTQIKGKDVGLRFNPKDLTFRKGRRAVGSYVQGSGDRVGSFSMKGTVANDTDYAFAEQVVRDIADELGITPRGAQGAIWGGLKKMYEERGWSPKDSVGPYRDALNAKVPEARTDVDTLFDAARKDILADPEVQKLKGRFQEQHAETIMKAAVKYAEKNGLDVNQLLRSTAIIGVPAVTMGSLSDDERKNKAVMALMALAGGHALGKAGAFKGMRPVGDRLWDSVFVGGSERIRAAVEKVGGRGASNFIFTNRALGPEYQGLREAALRERSEWVMKAKELQKRVGQYGEAFNRLLSRGIDEGWDEAAFGRALTGEGLDPTDAKVIQDIHDTFDSLGRLMVAQHWISQQAFDRHTGRYAPRLYEKGKGGVSRTEADVPLRPDRDRALDRTRFRGAEPAEGRELLEDGAFRAATGMVQEGHLTATGNFMEAVAGNDEWTHSGIRSLRARKLDVERQLAEINRGEADLIDVAGGALKEEAPDQMALQAELDKLTSQIRDEGIEAERKGFVLMGDDHRYGALRGQWVRPEVKQDIEGFLKAEGIVGKAVRWYEQNMLGPWKRAKTIYNPATHGRNLAGAQLLSYLGNGPTPFGRHFLKAVKAMKSESGELYRLAREQGLMDSSAVDGLGITAVGGAAKGDTLARAMEELKRPGAKAQGVLTFGVSAIPGLDDKLTRLYAGGDQVARVAHFDHAMKVRGMSVEEAAADAKRWVPTYDNLSHASKLWSTFGAPFWAYTAVALPRVAEGVVKHPIRFMTFGTLAYAFEKLFTPADVPDSIMPPEMRGAGAGLGLDEVGLGAVQEVANFMFPTRFALPTNDPSRRTYADLTYMFPYGDIAEGRGRDTGPLGALPSNFNPGQAGGPFIGQAKELLLNKVHFTGRPVTRLSDSPGEKVQGVADYLYKSNFPSLSPAIPGVTEGGYGFQKIRDSIMHRTEDGWEFGAPQPNYMGDTRDWYSAIPDALIGTKQRQIDLGTEMERRIRALDYERQDAMAAAREVFRDAGSTEGQKERARARAAEKIQRINEQIARIVADGRAAGITPGRN